MSERVVPFYACKHGIPGGCSWCNAVESAQPRECQSCGRIMSAREASEQSVCNDCSSPGCEGDTR